MIDAERAGVLASSLPADGGIFGQALGVPPGRIDPTYPAPSQST